MTDWPGPWTMPVITVDSTLLMPSSRIFSRIWAGFIRVRVSWHRLLLGTDLDLLDVVVHVRPTHVRVLTGRDAAGHGLGTLRSRASSGDWF